MREMIDFDNFWWKYRSSDDWVLNGIDLEVKEGEFLAITGPSGAGKTTLCTAINGLIPHTFRGTMKGCVTVDGVNTLQQSVADLSRKVGMVFQDPESQFIGMSVEEEVIFGPENLAVSVEEIRRRLIWALHIVGMEGTERKAPGELSGGQKQRIAIASALVMLPKILVLDEPTSELDPIGKASVFSAVSDLRRDYKVTTVLVEHNTEEVAKAADRVILVDKGEIRLDAPPEEFFSNVEILKESGVEVPQVVEFGRRLQNDGILGKLPVTTEAAFDAVARLIGR